MWPLAVLSGERVNGGFYEQRVFVDKVMAPFLPVLEVCLKVLFWGLYFSPWWLMI